MKNFLPYKQTIELIQLGFNQPCLATIDQTDFVHIKGTRKQPRGSMMYDTIDCPLYQEVLEWFRDEKDLFAEIFIDDDKTYGYLISYFVEQGRADKPIKRQFKTYNEAQLACIDVMISTIKTTTLTVKII